MLAVALFTISINNLWAEDAPFYTLTFPQLSSSSPYNSYTSSHTTTCGEGLGAIEWTVFGNQTVGANLRVGGKNITATDRTLTAGSTILSAISKVSIVHSGTANGSNSSITVNSITISGSTSSNFTGSKSKTINSPSVGAAGTLDFSLDEGNWDMNSYYKITVNYQITGSNNCYLTINSIKFYANAAPTEPVTVTFDAGVNGSCGTTSLTEAKGMCLRPCRSMSQCISSLTTRQPASLHISATSCRVSRLQQMPAGL